MGLQGRGALPDEGTPEAKEREAHIEKTAAWKEARRRKQREKLATLLAGKRA